MIDPGLPCASTLRCLHPTKCVIRDRCGGGRVCPTPQSESYSNADRGRASHEHGPGVGVRPSHGLNACYSCMCGTSTHAARAACLQCTVLSVTALCPAVHWTWLCCYQGCTLIRCNHWRLNDCTAVDPVRCCGHMVVFVSCSGNRCCLVWRRCRQSLAERTFLQHALATWSGGLLDIGSMPPGLCHVGRSKEPAGLGQKP